MVSLDVDRTDPVTTFALLWLVAGSALTVVGLYRATTATCGPASAGCGDSFGFVFVLWGVGLAVVATTILLGRIAFQTLTSSDES